MNKKRLWVILPLMAFLTFLIVAACAAPTPEVIEKEVVVEKEVPITVEVEKEKVVEKEVLVTVEVEKEKVVEKVVTATPEPTPEPSQAETTVTVIQGVDPVSLDPHVGESGPKINVLIHMFDTLAAINDDMVVVPQAAEYWEVSEDKLTWRVKIRKDVSFWNGEPLDAHAVKYTIERMLDEDLRAKGLNDPFPSRVKLDRVEVVDDYTVDIITKSPVPLMPLRLTYVFIMEPTHYASLSFEEASINPMGSSAFKFVEWVRDDHMTIERNPDWWGGTPDISKIIFRVVPEASVRLSELETGGVDLITDVKPEDMARVAVMPNAHISWVNGGRRIHIGFNVSLDHFKDVRVRQAFNYAINWGEISTALLNGMGKDRLVTVTTKWYPPDLEAYPYDPEKALALLEEAGYPMDKKLILNTPNGRYLKDVEIGQAVAAQLGQIGIEVEVVPLEWSVMSGMIKSRQMNDLFLLGLGSRFVGLQDLDSLRPDGTYNPGGWVNDAYLAARAEANNYMDPEEQMPYVWEAARVAHEDCPWIFLYRQIAIYGVGNRLEGWHARPDERVRLDHFQFK